MKIADLFSSTPPETKTASAAPAPQTPAPPAGLVQASMQETLQAAGIEQTKLAAQAAGAPEGELQKMAAALIEASAERNTKLAAQMGRAFGQGLLETIAAHEQANAKLAAQQGTLDVTDEQALYEKFAGEWTERVHAKTAEHYLHGQQLIEDLLALPGAQTP